jgi:hypothetical protein
MAGVQSDNLGQDEFIFGEDINLNVEKTLSRDLTLYIEPLIQVKSLRMEMKININVNVYIYKHKKTHT